MAVLYTVAQSLESGRVINTTNACESFVGYGTLFGDTVGDFAIFKNTTVSQVYKIGDDLGLSYDLVHKTPSDGLTGKSDEEVLGVSYDDIENYMDYDGITVVDIETAKKFNIIKQLHEKSQFKRDIINLPSVIIWLLQDMSYIVYTQKIKEHKNEIKSYCHISFGNWCL